MRYEIVTDFPALKSVLADIARNNIDKIIYIEKSKRIPRVTLLLLTQEIIILLRVLLALRGEKNICAYAAPTLIERDIRLCERNKFEILTIRSIKHVLGNLTI